MLAFKLLKRFIRKNKYKLLKLKDKLLKLFVKEQEPVIIEENTMRELTQEEKYELIDLSKYPEPVFLSEYDKNKKTVIIVDDLTSTKVLYEVAINNLERQRNFNIIDKFNIIYFFGKNIGFSVLYFLREKDIKIDYAILDITINTLTKVKLDNIDFFDIDPLEVDGVDLAIELNKKDSDTKIIFNSAHSMNPRNPSVSSFMAKYKKHFNSDMRDVTIDKLSNLTVALCSFLDKDIG